MRLVIILAVAGALGTLSRYGLSELTHRLLGQGFPYGTLAANTVGCFVIGLAAGLGAPVIPKDMHLAATTGFLGAFTTFSALSLDSFRMLSDGRWGAGLANIALNIGLGLAAVMAGFVVARLIRTAA